MLNRLGGDRVLQRSPARQTNGESEVLLPALASGQYHLFLSHVWSTAQDQMRVVKQKLQEMVPTLRVFLDVDDLTEGKGAEFVDASETILVMITHGYFRSPNCMRELLRAVVSNKPIVTMLVRTQRHQTGEKRLP